MSARQVSKNRWGDLLEEEEELPTATTSGPDAKGIITKVEYFRNDKVGSGLVRCCSKQG